MECLEIGLDSLKLEEVYAVAYQNKRVILTHNAKERIRKAHSFLLSEIKAGKTLYGVNTGFGSLANVKIPEHQIAELQINLLRSHAVGLGEYLDDSLVRALWLLRIFTLAKGHSGVSIELVEFLLELLNKGVCPLVPMQGSVGASGDLAPLAHLALVVIGEGKAKVHGKIMDAQKALKEVGLKPFKLGPKEGLSLINGTQFMCALGVIALLDAEYLCDLSHLTAALSLDVFRGSYTPFENEIHQLRNHYGQVEVAKKIQTLFLSKERSEISKSHENCGKVQDPYSFRCIPQVHGACVDLLRVVRGILEREINSVTDNPLVFPEEEKILSGGNFHGQIVAFAMDILAISLSEIASISERRIDKLLNTSFSDLYPFLMKDSGLNSGFMMLQVTAASLVSENKTLCHPASIDSIPTSAEKEDHVSMGAWAAVKAKKVLENTKRVIAIELLCGAQALDLLRPLKTVKSLENIHQQIRTEVPYLEKDHVLHDLVNKLEVMIEQKKFDVQIS